MFCTEKLTVWCGKLKKKKLLTHYEFRKAIALAWLTGKSCSEQQGEGTKQKRDSTVSMITCSVSSTSCAKVARVNDAALDPSNGSLKGRLNDNYVHYPEPSTAKQPCCSLCHVVNPNRNIRAYTSVCRSDICKVHLCVQCFKPFHTIASVKHLKSQVLSFLWEKWAWMETQLRQQKSH